MDPFTVALAVFGVQKLRGKSTGRSFRDALIAATGAQALTAAQPGLASDLGIKGFEFGGPFGALSAGKEASLAAGLELGPGVAGPTLAPTLANQFAQTGLGQGLAAFKSLPFGEKALVTAIGAPLIGAAFTDEEPPAELPEGFRAEDYAAARGPAREQVKGVGERARYGVTQTPSYTPTYPYGLFNQGGIVNALPKFSVGGINYLPSKVTHDENDINNYNRTNGYVEDGTGNGNKDEDTILAQLADGEFVSRADAILGAGILEGASPNNQKDMRKKGAAFFYDQQAKFKRIFDLLDASRKTIN